MAQINWALNGSGDWGVGTNWSGGVAPTQIDAVTINAAGITVTVSSSDTAYAYSLSIVGATLSITGGTLYTVSTASFNGSYVQSGGVYIAGGYGATFLGSTVLGKLGTIEVLTGALNIDAGASLTGTLAGAGSLDLNGGNTYINAGFTCTLNTISLQGGNLGFNTNFTWNKALSVTGGSVLDLFGHTLGLAKSSTALLAGTIGNGVINDTGSLTLGTGNAAAVLDNGLLLNINHLATQGGNVSVGAGDAGARITVAKAGNYEINGDWSVSDPSLVGTIVNNGVFGKSAGARTATIYADFVSSKTGTLNTASGVLLLTGVVNSLAGTVSGAGTLAIGGGGETVFGTGLTLNMAGFAQQGAELILNKSIGYAGEWDQTGGELNLNSGKVTLSLSGQTDISGGLITGYGGTLLLNNAPGTVDQIGSATIGGPTTLTITGVLDQTHTIVFGQSSNPVANILAGASWILQGTGSQGDNSIVGDYGVITNKGTFGVLNSSGDAVVQAALASTGVIVVNTGTLTLEGNNSLAGTVYGSGTLDLGPSALSGNSTVLQKSLALKVAALNVDQSTVYLGGSQTYAGLFSQTTGTLDLVGNNFSLTGATTLDGGVLTDGGQLSTAGATVIDNYVVTSGATLLIAGQAEQTESGQLIDNASITIAKSASFTFDDDVSISGTGGLLTLAGALIANGTGASQILPAVVLTGSLAVNDQSLSLGGGGSLAGTITGAGTLALTNLSGAETYTLGAGLSLQQSELVLNGGVRLSLAANASYGNSFSAAGTIALNNDTLALSGSTDLVNNFTLIGAGKMSASGSTLLSSASVLSGATLTLSGSSEQYGGVTVGDQSAGTQPPSTASLAIAAGAQYALDANQTIFGNGTLSVAGTLTAVGVGNSTIGPNVVDTGMISAALGTLNMLASITGAGAFSIGATSTLEFSAGSTITAATSIDFSATAKPGACVLLINDPAADLPNFGATLVNFVTNDAIEVLGINGTPNGSLTNNNHNLVLSDAQGDSITLSFTTAQNLASFSFTTTSNGIAEVLHT